MIDSFCVFITAIKVALSVGNAWMKISIELTVKTKDLFILLDCFMNFSQSYATNQNLINLNK